MFTVNKNNFTFGKGEILHESKILFISNNFERHIIISKNFEELKDSLVNKLKYKGFKIVFSEK